MLSSRSCEKQVVRKDPWPNRNLNPEPPPQTRHRQPRDQRTDPEPEAEGPTLPRTFGTRVNTARTPTPQKRELFSISGATSGFEKLWDPKNG